MLQDKVYTALPEATVINVSLDILHLFVPIFIPKPDTQVVFNESIKTTLSYHLIHALLMGRLLKLQKINAI